jgi:hypothetical protein
MPGLPAQTDANVQFSYQWYADDQSLGTVLAAQDTPLTIGRSKWARLRVAVSFVTMAAGSRVFLQHRINSGAWTLTTTGTVVRIAPSLWVADGDNAGRRLTSSTGIAFANGEIIETGRNSASFGVASLTAIEWEWNLRFEALNFFDLVEFRLLTTSSASFGVSGAVLDTYSVTPTLQVTGVERMPFRASVYEATQLGVESSPGTAVAATKRLLCTEMAVKPMPNLKPFRPQGAKFNTTVMQAKERGVGSISGQLAYNDLVYLMSSWCSRNTPGVFALVSSNSGSTYTLTFRGQVSGSIAGTATAATVQTALAALSTIGTGNVIVTGTAPNYTVQIVNTVFAGSDQITGTGAGLVSIGLTNAIAPQAVGQYTLTASGSASTYTLTFNGQTTGSLAGTANAATIQSALVGLTSIGTGNVTVTQSSANVYAILFTASLSGTQLLLTGTGTGLTSLVAPTISSTRRWQWQPLQNAPDSPVTYTQEQGSSSAGAQAAFALVNGMTMTFTKDEASIKGDYFTRTITDNFTLTTGVADVPAVPVDPASTSIYVGDSLLTMTRLTKCLKLELNLGDKYDPIMTINDAVTSLADYVEKAVDATFKFTVELDSTAFTLLSRMRSATTQFIRVESLGPVIENNIRSRVQMTFPVKFLDAPRDNMDGVFTTEFNATLVYDPTLVGAYQIIVDNAISSL